MSQEQQNAPPRKEGETRGEQSALDALPMCPEHAAMGFMAGHRLVGLLVLAACSGQSGREPAPMPMSTVALPSSPKPGDSSVDPRQVSVLLKQPPAGLTIDGKLDEWGSLAPLVEQTAAEPEPWIKQPYGSTPVEPASYPADPNQAEATSHLALALQDALWVAADLGESARNGIWLGVGAAVPPLPPIGFPGPSGYLGELDCEFEQDCCNDGQFIRGPALAPQVAQACREKLERHEAFVLAHGVRFQRMYRVGPRGVSVRETDGRLTPVAGAKVVILPHPGGAHLEASLPLEALPLFSQAPVSTLRFVARALADDEAASDSLGGGDVSRRAWVWLAFPEPISFEPNAELRELAYSSADGQMLFHPCLAYQAADRERMEFVRHGPDHTTLVRHEEPLYKKLNTLGDVEVGELEVPVRRLVIRKPGSPAAALELHKEHYLDLGPALVLRSVTERNGDLHYLAFSPGYYSPISGPINRFWWLTIVHPDGSYDHDVLDGILSSMAWGHADVTEFANADFSRFGIRGPERDPPNNWFELTWTWNAAKNTYVSRQRALPKPRPKKASR